MLTWLSRWRELFPYYTHQTDKSGHFRKLVEVFLPEAEAAREDIDRMFARLTDLDSMEEEDYRRVVINNNLVYSSAPGLDAFKEIARRARTIESHRGTVSYLSAILKAYGFDGVSINDTSDNFNLDNGDTLDDQKFLDTSTCTTCFDYEVLLTGTIPTPLSDEMVDGIKAVVQKNNPIWANPPVIKYNGNIIA